jgi:hypothetical protein
MRQVRSHHGAMLVRFRVHINNSFSNPENDLRDLTARVAAKVWKELIAIGRQPPPCGFASRGMQG